MLTHSELTHSSRFQDDSGYLLLQLPTPPSTLFADGDNQLNHRLKLLKTLKGFYLFCQLHLHLQVFYRQVESFYLLYLWRLVIQRSHNQAANPHSLPTHLCANGVLMVARKSPDRLLYFNQEPVRITP